MVSCTFKSVVFPLKNQNVTIRECTHVAKRNRISIVEYELRAVEIMYVLKCIRKSIYLDRNVYIYIYIYIYVSGKLRFQQVTMARVTLRPFSDLLDDRTRRIAENKCKICIGRARDRGEGKTAVFDVGAPGSNYNALNSLMKRIAHVGGHGERRPCADFTGHLSHRRLVRPIRFVASVTQGVRHYSARREDRRHHRGNAQRRIVSRANRTRRIITALGRVPRFGLTLDRVSVLSRKDYLFSAVSMEDTRV